jgi:hypothetical protein
MVSSWKKVLALSLTAVVAVVSFMAFSYFLGRDALASEESGDINVASLDEASTSVGYRVVAPAFVPTSFEKRDVVFVMKLHVISDGPESRPVEQEWRSADGSWFSLIQLPGLAMPALGDDVQIGNKLGKKVLIPTNPKYGLPPTLALYWQDGTRGYSLGGSLTESLSEEMLVAIANSVE